MGLKLNHVSKKGLNYQEPLLLTWIKFNHNMDK